MLCERGGPGRREGGAGHLHLGTQQLPAFKEIYERYMHMYQFEHGTWICLYRIFQENLIYI